MRILYLTSFNSELYEATGINLIDSYLKYDKNSSSLFIGTENVLMKFDHLNHSKIIQYNLDRDVFLQSWLEDHADIIPEYLGGKAKPCNCRNPFGRKDKHHKRGCYFSWWNRNCSRWFRKIACLNRILFLASGVTTFEFDVFIWVDCDCIFKRSIPDNIWVNLFANNDVFYMRGKKRRAVETGIFGIKNNKAGHNFIFDLVNYYILNDFKNYDRWDDGFIFKFALNDSAIKSLDIAKNCTSSEVAQFTVLTPYIIHNKGTHGKKLDIMK